MKLYGYWRSTSSWRVRIVLAYKAIEYEDVAVDLSPEVSGQRADGFEGVNAFRQVPVLETTEEGRFVRLTQSVAIVEYLEEKYPTPGLLPEHPLSRAWVREAVETVNSGIQPLQNVSVLATVEQLGGEVARQEWARGAIGRGLTALEARVRRTAGRFSVGDSVTLADVYLVPQLYNARRFGVGLDSFPTLCRIEGACEDVEAFTLAHPSKQPDAR